MEDNGEEKGSVTCLRAFRVVESPLPSNQGSRLGWSVVYFPTLMNSVTGVGVERKTDVEGSGQN